jgi:hypothetical protein
LKSDNRTVKRTGYILLFKRISLFQKDQSF